MSTHDFDEEDVENDLDTFTITQPILTETNPTTKLERRRRIEDLFEEKRLKEELEDFA